MAPPLLHVLTGCTAVGKTELALRWAEAHGAEILSCDSLLFYRGLDIGTAKPSPAERARVPHHLIDLTDLRTQLNITQYVDRARAVLADLRERGRPALVTGGSGFYLQAFFSPVADEVEVPAALRAELRARLEAEGREALVRELEALNPGGLGALDRSNPRRVVRALERCRATGRTLAELRAAFAARPAAFADYEVRLCELVRPHAELAERIERRVAAMLAAGLVAEVRGLLAAGLKENPSAARAIGYRETIQHLEGRLPAGELAAAIVRDTRALVRKQRTWFRTQLPPHPQVAAATAAPAALFPPAS